MGPSSTGESYPLIIKDDAGKHVWLCPTKSADAATTAESLVELTAAFGVSHIWISDQGPHFVKEVMRQLTPALKINHRFSPAFTPHANGTVEAVCKQVLRSARSLLVDFGLQPDDWSKVLPLIQSVINHSTSSHLAGKSAMAAFTGRSDTTLLQCHWLGMQRFLQSTTLFKLKKQ